VKPSLKTITLRNLINFLLLLTVVILVVLGVRFRQISVQIMEDKALALAEVVKGGLTAHMKGGIMDKRDYFLNEINSLTLVENVKIIRSKEVNSQFGAGLDLEEHMDDMTRQVFERGEPIYVIDDLSLHPNMRAVVPFIASSKGELNCLKCHNVTEGTVLGAISLEMDLTGYRNITLALLLVVGGIAVVFIVLIISNNVRTIQHHVQGPLEELIKRGEDAYYKNTPIDESRFECAEFENVAREFNMFAVDILQNQSEIETKTKRLEELSAEIEDAHKETIYTMGVIEEHRSKETNYHTMRVTQYCALLAQKAGLSEYEVDLITTAAPLHDIGKLSIPDSILMKPCRLTDEEFAIMKNHAEIGFNMLRHSKRDVLSSAAIIAHQHHERWDGAGYPRGLKGDQIHVFGRIVALVDVFDALATKRVYKEKWPLDEVARYIESESGRQFDPKLSQLLLNNFDEFVAILNKYQ